MCLKFFGKAKIIKAPAGFQLVNYRLVVITLEHTVLATLLDNKKKEFRKILFFLNYNQTYCLFRSDIRHTMEMFHTTLISHNVYI